ncbi:MAG TPA: hypothetical protein VFL96_10625 [Acidobacteriaceae bacterium]|nr:hypothetical protein [Acidobacteriaceae bacterium]
MADDPNRPLGDRDRVEREVGARVGYGWIWIWIAIIIILVIWFGGFGWGGYGGWWWGHRPRTALVGPNQANGGPAINGQPAPGGSPAAVTGSGVQILTSANKQPFVGQPFVINNVPVQNAANDRAFWIGANDNDTMLVVLTGNQNNARNSNAQKGVRVNISGTVERAPSAEQAKRMWSLSDDDAKKLEQQGVFVQATQVEAGPAGQRGQQTGPAGQP